MKKNMLLFSTDSNGNLIFGHHSRFFKRYALQIESILGFDASCRLLPARDDKLILDINTGISDAHFDI